MSSYVLYLYLCLMKNTSAYDQDMPQSQITEQYTTLQERDTDQRKPHTTANTVKVKYPTSADPEEGDRGSGTPPPLRKFQVIWVSIGNKQLDPPGKSWTPPW